LEDQKILEKITEDYVHEGNEQRDAILAEAREEAQRIASDAAERASAIMEDAKKQGEEEKRRASLIASLDARKATLKAKRDLLDEAFAGALSKLESLGDDDWGSLICSIIKNSGARGDEKIFVPEGAGDRFGRAGILDKINTGGNHFSFGGEDSSVKSGVLISGTKTDIDCSFETLLTDWRASNERAVYSILFPEEDK
jgi:vacuolar-type H+-ATPase subunit E/Vma4